MHSQFNISAIVISLQKNVPCPISDKFQSIKKQTDMEDAAEKLFKKKSTKGK